MKVCSKCKRELDESMFYRYHRNRDGLLHYCKDCRRKYMRENSRMYKENAERNRIIKENNDINQCLGGYRIYILNRPKTGECKFNIVPTLGDVFKTNSKQDFIRYLEGI